MLSRSGTTEYNPFSMLAVNMRRSQFIPMLRGAAVPSGMRPLAAGRVAGDPHRRKLLTGFLAASLTAVTGWYGAAIAAALPLSRDRFLELSKKLCSMPIDDGSLADAIQTALVDQYAVEDLRRLADLLNSASSQDVERLVAGSGLHELAKSIVSVWYSGLLGTGERTRLLAYEEALVWRATSYAKAPGTCGEFGDWITKPSTLFREQRP
jgi:hypothetical protein